MCPCDRINGIVCPAHCIAPELCQDRDHVDRCLGPLPVPRWALAIWWRMGYMVTPEMVPLLKRIYEGAR